MVEVKNDQNLLIEEKEITEEDRQEIKQFVDEGREDLLNTPDPTEGLKTSGVIHPSVKKKLDDFLEQRRKFREQAKKSSEITPKKITL